MENSEQYYHKVQYYNKNSKKLEQWFKNGVLHRDDDQPAEIDYCFNISNQILRVVYYQNGLKHRDDDKPAEIQFDDNNNIIYECYYKLGKLHRENDLPAMTKFWYSGEKTLYWIKEDMFHRENDKPAIISYYRNGKIKNEEWYFHNNLFRFGIFENQNIIQNFKPKPSIIYYDENQEIENILYNLSKRADNGSLIISNDLSKDKYKRMYLTIRRLIQKYQKYKKNLMLKNINQSIINHKNGNDISNLISDFI